MVCGRFLVNIKSSNRQLFFFYIQTILKLCAKNQICVIGPVVFPTKTKKIVFLRSVHIYKTSRESFDFSVFKGLLIFEFTSIDYLKVFYFIMFLKYRMPLGLNLVVRKIAKINF